MNSLTRFQRKLVYLGLIIALAIPVVFLGQPAGGPNAPGGKLAQLRTEYELSEDSFGKIDPASSTMNLVLLGLRGPAVTWLWLEAQELQKKKQFAELRTTADSIIMLQPHYMKVWEFQAWNLAFNVSAEWDGVADRYYWVKEGIKFLRSGVEQNQKYAALYWYMGDMLGRKIGRSDEWREFRKFFRKDPNTEQFGGGPDTDINPNDRDNYKVAGDWFIDSDRRNEAAKPGQEQHIMAKILFRASPARANMDFATVQAKEGIFDEAGLEAWITAFRDWTENYGRQEYDTPDGVMVHLEVDDQERAELSTTEEGQIRLKWVDSYQKMTNYNYWRLWAEVHANPRTMETYRKLFEGEDAFRKGDFVKARDYTFEGLAGLEAMLAWKPGLLEKDEILEDVLIAHLFWRDALSLLNEREPENYPLKIVWEQAANFVEKIKPEFRRRSKAERAY